MLPEKFKSRMKGLLGEDYPRFIDAIENRPAVRGLRLSSCCDAAAIADLPVEPLPYCEGGYILRDGGRVGSTPAHHAGLFYMQDPGAMAAVAAICIPEGARVADLCAAPGGKSTQAAARLGEGGFLLSNEYVKKRAWITVGNMERLGVRNALVTSYDTSTLAELYPEYFDLVICDAPCSGEGMFRKGEVAREEWSPENVTASAVRQREILSSAVAMLADGGTLLYSTCTYSTEENEENVLWLLERYPELEIIPLREEVVAATAPGIPIGGCEALTLTRRFYPHLSQGEGQYIAALRRRGGRRRELPAFRESTEPARGEELSLLMEFLRDTLTRVPEGRIVRCGGGLALIAHGCPIPPHSVLMPGVLIGEVRGKMLIPSHQFFSAYGRDFIRREELDTGDGRVEKYLRGEEIEAVSTTGRGWVALTYRGVPLGGGKLSGGVIKNHYPKGLRNK